MQVVKTTTQCSYTMCMFERVLFVGVSFINVRTLFKRITRNTTVKTHYRLKSETRKNIIFRCRFTEGKKWSSAADHRVRSIEFFLKTHNRFDGICWDLFFVRNKWTPSSHSHRIIPWWRQNTTPPSTMSTFFDTSYNPVLMEHDDVVLTDCTRTLCIVS